MLDEKDLQAIAQLMTGLESRMDQKMAQQKKEIIRETMVLMESYFDPKFQALSEQINPVPKEAIDTLEDRVDDLEKAVELHTQQINELKKAQ
jgi:archaellum component FlaC|nr:MAG TPA: Heat shock factor-binding protein 1 helix, Nucleus, TRANSCRIPTION.8A [Caudoviricetes sp.]